MQGTFEMSDSVVLITGGTRGIGRGIATRFSELGATVVVVGRRAPEPEIKGARFLGADLREADQVDALFQEVRQRYGRLDVLINNAGGSPPAAAATASANFSSKIIALNLLAPLLCAQAAHALMSEQAGGASIINIASVSGVRPSPGTAASAIAAAVGGCEGRRRGS